jgi:hypothetical protein
VPGRRQLAGVLIDPEGHHRVAVLVGNQKQMPRWIDGEKAGASALAGFVANLGQFARCLVDLIDHDAVVPPVRAVHEPPRRRNGDLGAQVLALEAIRQG